MEKEKIINTETEILCHSCEKNYVVPFKSMHRKNDVQNCPHCDAKIDEKTWIEIVEAVWGLQRANEDFLNNHLYGDAQPLFTVVSIRSNIADEPD